jgi:UDP-N-acetylmuramyl pentapeptide synthase
MVELGSASDAIHEKLGELARGVCSKVILVGTTSRTKSLARGLGDNRFVFMDNIKNLWQEVEKLRLDPIDTVILLENDLPDNY